MRNHSQEEGEEGEDEKEAADLAGQAGWELAGLLSGNFDKKAADSMVRSTLEEIIKTASDDADKVASFLVSYEEELVKNAGGEMPAGIDPAAMGMGGAGPDEMAGMDPEAMGGDPEAMGGGDAGGDRSLSWPPCWNSLAFHLKSLKQLCLPKAVPVKLVVPLWAANLWVSLLQNRQVKLLVWKLRLLQSDMSLSKLLPKRVLLTTWCGITFRKSWNGLVINSRLAFC
jgi:hypothetical protein